MLLLREGCGSKMQSKEKHLEEKEILVVFLLIVLLTTSLRLEHSTVKLIWGRGKIQRF